jgi:putative transposase
MEIRDKLAYGAAQRIFRAKGKVNEPGHISHITQRAAGKEPLFLEKDDYLAMLGLLKESAERFNLDYYALCLMPNHVHILIEPQLRNLPRAMHYVFSNYAARFNYKYQRKGHLFGGPYRQAVCLDSSYLLSASVYIHLNPAKDDLCTSPETYRWSSCSLYCWETEEDSFVNPSPVLELLDDDPATARREYFEILRHGQGTESDNALEQEGAIEKFCLQLADMFPSLFRKLSGKQKKDDKGADELVDIVSLEKMIREFDPRPVRDPQSKESKKYVVRQLLARGFSRTEIASKLQISRKTVYNILNS